MKEKTMPIENQADNQLFDRLLQRQVFTWENDAPSPSTIGELIDLISQQTVKQKLAEILSNATLTGKTVLDRVTPRVESWQAAKLLDHFKPWLTVRLKKFWQLQIRA